MVTNNHSWEEQTVRLLTEAQSEMATIERELIDLQERYKAIRKEVEAYEIALQSFRRRSGQPVDVDWNTLLANAQTHKERIVTIVNHYGAVRPNKLTDVLFPRFIKSKSRSNAYQIVQMNLADLVDAGIMEKTEHGEYRLISSQQNLPMDSR